MKKIIILLLFTYCHSGFSKNPPKLKVLDSKNSRIYRGPKNPNGKKDLSTYILRAKPQSALRYFTGDKIII